MNPLFPDPDRILLAGDWHGNGWRAADVIRSAGRRGIRVVLQLGDFGFWTPGGATKTYLDIVEEAAVEHGVAVLFVDGNHEYHPGLLALSVDPRTGLRRIRDHVHHLPRGFRWTWHGRTWLALGGAHSVDRHMRTEGRSWWPEEHLSRAEADAAIAGGPVDVVVAHDCPFGVYIPNLPGGFPPAQLAMADAHRRLVGEVADAVRPGWWFHGHYHVSYSGTYQLPDGATVAVRGLADDTSPWGAQIAILDVREMREESPFV